MDDSAPKIHQPINKWKNAEPESFKPSLTTWALTENVAADFAKFADWLHQRNLLSAIPNDTLTWPVRTVLTV